MKFNRSQLVFMVECILRAALDRIECQLPTSLSYEDRVNQMTCGNDQTIAKTIRELSWYQSAALDTAGMALGCLYARLSHDGLSIGDALHCAGDFLGACEKLVSSSWKNRGQAIFKKEKELRKLQEKESRSWRIDDCYENYPNTLEHSKTFVDKCFKEYLA